MNFASQAIYAGFSGSNNLTSVNAGTAPQDTVGIAAGQPNAAQTNGMLSQPLHTGHGLLADILGII